ncbi:unnamed protein product [Camellia sinensis]
MARAGGITNAVNVGIAVQADWENREFISHISLNVRRLFDFLVQFVSMPLNVGVLMQSLVVYGSVPSNFGLTTGHWDLVGTVQLAALTNHEATTKSKLASLNEKLDTLERRLELLEVQVGTASANPSLFNA